MSSDEQHEQQQHRVFWVREHVRRRADGTEVVIQGHYVGMGALCRPTYDQQPFDEGDDEESQ